MLHPQSSNQDINRIYRGFDAHIDRNAAIQSTAHCDAGSRDFARLAMNGETGVGHWDVLRLYDDLLVCAADSYYHDRFRFDIRPPVNLASIRFVVSGGLQLRSGKTRAVDVEEGTASMWGAPSLCNHVVAIRPRRRLASLTLHFHADRLASIVGLDPDELPELLRSFDRDEGALRFCSTPLTPAMRNGVLALLDSPLEGSLRRRYVEAKVMELVCLFIDAADRTSQRKDVIALTASDREWLYHAREIVAHAFLDPPSIATLARMVGVNRTKLQSGFRAAFGVTIFDFCHGKRMALARELLQDPSLSISEVADAVGYSQATNFTAAFRRHFKQLPKQMRSRDARS